VTTLSHVVVDGSNHPISGRKAQVAVYLGGPDSPTPGTFQKVGVVNAISDSHGAISWDLPKYPGHGTPTYVVTGIEDHPVVVRVPQDIPATTVSIARIAILDQLDGPLVDLVTEDELIARLSALPTPPAPSGGGVIPADHISAYSWGINMPVLNQFRHVIGADMGSQEAFTLTGDWPISPSATDQPNAIYTIWFGGAFTVFHPGTVKTGTLNGLFGDTTATLNYEVTSNTTGGHFEVVFTSGRFDIPLAGQIIEIACNYKMTSVF